MGTQRAFTLVEILITLAIIATVVTVPVLAYGSITRNARDTRRKQDIDKVSAALQQYRSETGAYPNATDYDDLGTFLIPKYLAQLPDDPQGANGPSAGYAYEVLGGGQGYNLYTSLEKRAGTNNEVYTSSPGGTSVITGVPPVPTGYTSPTGNILSRTPTPSKTPIPSATPLQAVGTYLRTIQATNYTYLADLAITSDKGHVVAGAVDFYTDRKAYIAKLNTDGTISWQKILNVADSYYESVTTVTGGIVAVGSNDSGSNTVTKFSNTGSVLWSRSISHLSGTTFSPSVVREASGEIFVAGTYSSGPSTRGIAIFKFTNEGQLLEKKTFTQGGGMLFFVVNDIQPTATGIVLVGNHRVYPDENYDAFFLKVSQDLSSIEAAKTYSFAASQSLEAVSSVNGGTSFIAAGWAADSDTDGLILQLDTNGTIQGSSNTARYGAGNGTADMFNDIKTVPGGYVVVGETENNKSFIAKLSAFNTITWMKKFDDEYYNFTAADYIPGTTLYYAFAGTHLNSSGTQSEIVVSKVSTQGQINSCPTLSDATPLAVSTSGSSANLSFTLATNTNGSVSSHTPDLANASNEIENSCN